MAQLDYQLNPVLMEGTVTKAAADDVALNLRGRLGVIHAAPSLFLHQPREGRKFRFYFSYMQIVEAPLDYDYAPLEKDREFTPVLAGGVLSEVNDTAIKADCLGGLAYYVYRRSRCQLSAQVKLSAYGQLSKQKH